MRNYLFQAICCQVYLRFVTSHALEHQSAHGERARVIGCRKQTVCHMYCCVALFADCLRSSWLCRRVLGTRMPDKVRNHHSNRPPKMAMLDGKAVFSLQGIIFC